MRLLTAKAGSPELDLFGHILGLRLRGGGPLDDK